MSNPIFRMFSNNIHCMFNIIFIWAKMILDFPFLFLDVVVCLKPQCVRLGGTSITYIVLSSLFILILNSFSRVHEHLKKLFTFYTTRFIYLIHCFCISAELSSYISFCSVLGKKTFLSNFNSLYNLYNIRHHE